LLSLPAGTEMFHFPALPPTALCIQAEATAHDDRRVSPFGHPRITAWLPAPRGLSQAPTSFIGSWCQGVHRVLLKTWHYEITYKPLQICIAEIQEMLASTVQFSRNRRNKAAPPRIRRERTASRKKTQTSACLFPQDPTVCPEAQHPPPPFRTPQAGNVLTERH
jgi:hypothetical protein